MTLETIISRLDIMGIPHECIQFSGIRPKTPPTPPYITWATDETGEGADSVVNLSTVNCVIALYTATLDETLLRCFEDTVLPDTGYTKRKVPIPSENLLETSYEFSFKQKRKRV